MEATWQYIGEELLIAGLVPQSTADYTQAVAQVYAKLHTNVHSFFDEQVATRYAWLQAHKDLVKAVVIDNSESALDEIATHVIPTVYLLGSAEAKQGAKTRLATFLKEQRFDQ